MDAETLKLIGSSGIAGALLALIYIVGMRLVGAISDLSRAILEHTKLDLQHHADVKTEVVAMRTKIDTLIDWQERTPVEPAPRKSTPSVGVYSLHRKDDRSK
jgi:hypothetical protein